MAPVLTSRKRAGAVRRLALAGLEAGLAEQGGLLVAERARDRRPVGRVAVDLGRAVDARQHRARHVERGEQLVVPVEGAQVHHQRAAGVGHVGDVPAGELPDEPAVHRAEQDLAPVGALAEPVHIVQQPAQLRAGEVGGERQAGPGREEPGVEGVEDRPGAGVLPDDRVVDGPAGRAVPDERGLPLVGDADRLDRPVAGGFGDDRLDVGPDLLGVVLDPAGPREDAGGAPAAPARPGCRRRRTRCTATMSCPGRWRRCTSPRALP